MASMREVLQGLQEGTPPPVVLASLEQLNELLLRSGGGSGAGSLRISSIVPALCRLLASEAGSGVEVSQNPHKARDHFRPWALLARLAVAPPCGVQLCSLLPCIGTYHTGAPDPPELFTCCVCGWGGGGDA
jgi:hypothetical protein